MEIQIGKSHYFIRSDPLNLILCEKRKRTSGKEIGEYYFDEIGYYSTIENLYTGLLKKKIRLSDATTLLELKKDVDEIKALIVESLSSMDTTPTLR